LRVVQKVDNRLRNKLTINQHRESDVDLELQLLHEIDKWESKQMPITVSFVRSHQELQKVKSELFHAENLNIIADSLAKKARKYKCTTQYQSLPQNPIDFDINNTTINAKYALMSTKAYHSIAFRKYLQGNIVSQTPPLSQYGGSIPQLFNKSKLNRKGNLI
jgi:hypothetical protein